MAEAGFKPLAPGTLLPDGAGEPGIYHIRSLLGVGGTAEVYAVTVAGRRGMHAIKIMFADRFVPMAFREGRWLSVAAPGAVPLHWVDHSVVRGSERAVVVMPCLREGNLAARLAEKTYTRVHVVQWITEIAQTLEALGVVHRDLKPENIMFMADHPLVGDFSLAVHADPRERERWGEEITRAGTPVYMSPEQHRCLTEIDVRSDIYALGLMFYELWTGELPFPYDLDARAVLMRAMDGHQLQPLGLASADAFVRTCVRYSRIERYQTWADALAALGTITAEIGKSR
jgi:serine/threonine protein kinase